ncbi:hypothetical protein [Kluyvera intermedia]|uniref:hypothetical protein n=1 Tax=Kluyvera intermedia TaxID=61648 RepID=UPI00370C7DA8
MNNREQFESWVSDNGKFQRALERKGDIYLLATINTQWEAWQAASKASEQQLAAVVAECASVKAMNDCLSEELRGYESDGAFEGPKMHLLWWQCETPATDAAIANIQAQGVDLFADMTDKVADEEEFYDNGESFDSLKYTAKQARLFAAQLRQGAAL